MQVNGDLDVTGTVTATSFIGDGSQLTGISGGTGGGLDSAAVTLLVDSDYVQARETPQDFAYSSLTGAPTALSSFTNDTSYITAADIPTTVDSDYVQARVTLDGVGLDSAGVTALVDSDYVALRAPAASGGLDSAGVTALINEPYLRDTLYDVAAAQTNIGLDAGFASTSNFSIAIGKESGINSGNATNSIAIGFKAGQNISDNSIMIGRETAEFSPVSFAVGIGTEALQNTAGNGAVAVGYRAGQNNSGDNSVAVGINAKATADYAVSIGDNATVSHPAVIGIAIGRNTSVTTPGGVGGVAIGSGASVSDNDTLAIGRNTVASAADATAIGPNTTASGLRSIAIGNNVTAITDDAVTIGSSVAGRVTYDTTNDWTFGATVNAPAFVGDGSGLTNLPSNALQVQAPTVTPEYFIYVGSPAGKLAQIQDSRGTATNLVYDQEFATLQEAFNFMMENPLADVGASSYSGGDKNATFVVSLEEGVTHSAGTSGYFRLGHVNAHIKLLSQNALNPAGTTPNVSTVGNFGEALVVYGIPQLQMGGDIVVNADAQIGYSNVKWFYNQYNDDVVWNGPIKIYDGCTFWTDGPINSRIWVETNSYAQVNALNNAALVRVRDGSELVTSDINSNATIQVVSAKLRANNITMNAGTLEVRRFANLHCDSITMNGTSVLYVDDASRVTHAGVSGNTTATNHKIGDAITPYTISEVIDMVNVSNLFTRDGTTFHDQTQTTNSIMVNDLPTTDPVNAGQLWNDAGTLKVSAG